MYSISSYNMYQDMFISPYYEMYMYVCLLIDQTIIYDGWMTSGIWIMWLHVDVHLIQVWN